MLPITMSGSWRSICWALITECPAAVTPPPLVCSAHVVGPGPTFRERACTMQLEGIVSKLRDALYRVGRRGGWLKVKRLNCELSSIRPPRLPITHKSCAVHSDKAHAEIAQEAGLCSNHNRHRPSRGLRRGMSDLRLTCPFGGDQPRAEYWSGSSSHLGGA